MFKVSMAVGGKYLHTKAREGVSSSLVAGKAASLEVLMEAVGNFS